MIRQQELGEKNIFEEIFELIERHRLRFDSDYFPLGDFYDVVSEFDKAFQKFNSKNDNYNNIQIFNQLLNYTIGNFLTIFRVKGFSDEPIFYAFKRFIAFFSFVLEKANLQVNPENIERTFLENFPSFSEDINNKIEEAEQLYFNTLETPLYSSVARFENSFPKEIGINDKLTSEKTLSIYANDFILKNIIWDKNSLSYKTTSEQFYMFINININSEDNAAEKLFTPLWLLSNSLSSIKNVKVEIDEIKKGSLITRLKILMKDIVAKEETKAVLEAMKETVIKVVTGGKVSYSEIKKTRHETRALELDNKKNEVELRQMPSDSEKKEEREIEFKKKRLENERLEIENNKAKLELIEKLSDLAAKGLIEVDFVEVSINDYLYFLKEKDEIKKIGPDISDIS